MLFGALISEPIGWRSTEEGIATSFKCAPGVMLMEIGEYIQGLDS